jgi:hypothetical protein
VKPRALFTTANSNLFVWDNTNILDYLYSFMRASQVKYLSIFGISFLPVLAFLRTYCDYLYHMGMAENESSRACLGSI